MKKQGLLHARGAVQLLMLLIVIVGASLRNIQHNLAGYLPELQGFCPIGAVQTIFRSIDDPSSLFRPDKSNLWVISGVILITLFFGAVFCSYLCPLGTLQEWIGRAGRKLFKRRFNRPLSPKVEKALGSLRWIFLGIIGLSVFGFITIELDLINPSYAFTHLWSSALPVTALLVLLLIAGLSLLYERPWCRWLCPYGVILGTLGKLSIFKIRRSRDLCIDCGKCDRACYAHIAVSAGSSINDSSCSRCRTCSDACPVPGALTSSGPSHRAAAAIVLILFFTPMAAAWAAGIYVPPGIQKSSPSAFDPASISPLITLDDLAGQMGIEYHELTELLDLPPDYGMLTMLIDIEEDLEFEHITVGYIRERILKFLDIKE